MTSPFLTLAEAATYLRFPSPAACRQWLRRQAIPIEKRGRTILVRRVSLDEALARNRRSA